jgi:predicted nucleic acid-binding protein
VSAPIVADASPLIGLSRIGLLRILRELYGRVVIPPAVHDELEIARRRPGYEALAEALAEGWLAPRAVETPNEAEQPGRAVGKGEEQALLLAERLPARFLLIDERAARAVAGRRGIPVVGTGGVLLVAKERGLIESVGTALNHLAAHRFRLSPQLRNRLLEMAGEKDPTAPAGP